MSQAGFCRGCGGLSSGSKSEGDRRVLWGFGPGGAHAINGRNFNSPHPRAGAL
jgi:hypothetical protein